MSLNILKKGFPLTVSNRSRGVVDDLAGQGATPAATPAEVAARSEIVCLCLPVPATVEDVVLGQNGVREGIKPGSVVLDFSTIGPSTCQHVAAALKEQQVSYLDAPVSGGTTGAEAGTLTIMVGGERREYERALPVLQAVGKKIVYAGPVGAGAVVKLMNQLLVGINLAGAAEAMVLGAKAGVDPQLLYDTISSATGNSFQLQRCFPDLILKGDFTNMFSVDLLHKDLALGVDVGRENRVRLLLGALALQVFEEARDLGLGGEDIAAAIKPLERLAGVEVRAK
jgi:3-hydroxyisobutyrate dehydrogenase-like beta-hydroxyacid dehydrogenase